MNAPRNALTRQGAAAPYFVPPPFNQSLPFAEFVDWHMTHSAEHEFVRLVPADDGKHTIVTMQEFGVAVHTLGRHFFDKIRVADSSGPMVVGISLATHSLLYATIMTALLRAGFQPFPIAPTMPEASMRHLLLKTDCRFIVASVNGADVSPILNKMHGEGAIELATSLSLEQLFPSLDREEKRTDAGDFDPLPALAVLRPSFSSFSWDDLPTFVLHTSGSTDLPKPIPLRQKALASWILCGWFGDIDMGGCVLPTGFLPPFHVTGIATLLAVPLSCGVHIAMDDPFGPTTPPTPTGILQFFKRSQADFVLVPPILCELWSRDDAVIDYLKSLKLVVVGTAALSQASGDKLVSRGVRLLSSYGSTEGGQIWQFRQTESFENWAYGKFAPYTAYRLIPIGLNRFLVELLETENYSPAVFNTPTGKGFNTHDVVEKHPYHEDLFRVVERDDNQLVLVTGESVLVSQLEDVVRQAPAVKQVSAFGHGRPQLGMIVEPSDGAHCAGEGLSEFRDLVRPYLLRANAQVPPHAQVPTDLVIVTGPGAHIPTSAKGSVPRALVARLFAAQIDAVYNAASESRSTLQPPQSWSHDDVRDFVHRVAQHVICGLVSDARLDESVDLFRQGCTSIHSAYIRSALANAAETHGRSRSGIPLNVVYLYPTISQLTNFLCGIGDPDQSDGQGVPKAERMASLAARFTSQFPRRQQAEPHASTTSTDRTVLLTGSTGALGTYILHQLLSDSAVDQVVVLIRQPGGLDRQIKAFIDRGVMPSKNSLAKLTVLQGDVCERQFGLCESDWQELLSSVTSVVHCAWRLDFNLNLNSYEPYLAGVSNLIDLVATSHKAAAPNIVFTSSIDTIHRWTDATPAPEKLLGAELAIGSGYGEAKWVADYMLSYAAKELGLSVTSIRISQLSGSRINGCWNVSDWVPQVVRAGMAFGALPTAQPGTLGWLPLDVAAEAVVRAAKSPSPGFRMLNIEHPRKVQWRDIFDHLAESVEGVTNRKIKAVTRAEWIEMLNAEERRQHGLAPEQRSALHIAQFLRDGWGEKWERWGGDTGGARDAMGMAHLDMVGMLEVFPDLASQARVEKEDVERWTRYWAKRGLFVM